MKITLLVAAWSPPCRRAEQIWRKVALAHGLPLDIVDVDAPAGQALTQRLRLQTIPALLIDDRLVAIGVQGEQEADRLLAAAAAKRPNPA
jgi:thioredoxin-like negative regulator of GroEL